MSSVLRDIRSLGGLSLYMRETLVECINKLKLVKRKLRATLHHSYLHGPWRKCPSQTLLRLFRRGRLSRCSCSSRWMSTFASRYDRGACSAQCLPVVPVFCAGSSPVFDWFVGVRIHPFWDSISPCTSASCCFRYKNSWRGSGSTTQTSPHFPGSALLLADTSNFLQN